MIHSRGFCCGHRETTFSRWSHSRGFCCHHFETFESCFFWCWQYYCRLLPWGLHGVFWHWLMCHCCCGTAGSSWGLLPLADMVLLCHWVVFVGSLATGWCCATVSSWGLLPLADMALLCHCGVFVWSLATGWYGIVELWVLHGVSFRWMMWHYCCGTTVVAPLGHNGVSSHWQMRHCWLCGTAESSGGLFPLAIMALCCGITGSSWSLLPSVLRHCCCGTAGSSSGLFALAVVAWCLTNSLFLRPLLSPMPLIFTWYDIYFPDVSVGSIMLRETSLQCNTSENSLPYWLNPKYSNLFQLVSVTILTEQS